MTSVPQSGSPEPDKSNSKLHRSNKFSSSTAGWIVSPLANTRPQDRRPPVLEACMPDVPAKKSAGVGLAGGMAADAANRQANDAGKELSKHRGSVSENGGGAAADRLEKRTHLDEAKYRIKLRNYGNGLGEIGWSFIPALIPKKAERGKSEERDDNENRASRRAKSRLRQLILSAGTDHLLTLTYRQNVTDFEQAASDLTRFVRLVKGKMPTWPYVAVPERQKRGAWHWHMAVKGRQDVVLLRSLWLQVVGEGNIDVNPPKGKGDQRQLALVTYLGKYLAKGFADDDRTLNGRRFRASLGIEVPMEYLTVPEEHRGDVAGYALNRLVVATGSIGFVWIADDKVAGWACSWK